MKKFGIVIVIILLCFALFYSKDLLVPGKTFNEANDKSIQKSISLIQDKRTQEYDNIYSKHMIMVDLNSRRIISEKEENEKTYPASLTKIMTAIVAIENISDLNEKIPVSQSIFDSLKGSDASMAGFLPGEKVPAVDLVYGTLLPSGAEAASALALYCAGSEEKFTGLMNEKAKALGMNNTHFTNVSGLSDPNHYTTVKDMAILLDYALQNDTFYKAFTAKKYSTSQTNKHPDGITFYSTMFQNLKNSDLEDGKILGGKTGFTSEAGLCLASLAEKEGKKYILVTTGARGDHQTKQFNIIDAFNIYNKY
ncbi:MAG TPA: serine hydrolase [Ruminiclostridium sp.]|nr:serine hydrolase [Ruminiclostridium sp.]